MPPEGGDPAPSRPSDGRRSSRSTEPSLSPGVVVAVLVAALSLVLVDAGVAWRGSRADVAFRLDPDGSLLVDEAEEASLLRPGDRVVALDGVPVAAGAGEGRLAITPREALRRAVWTRSSAAFRLDVARDGEVRRSLTVSRRPRLGVWQGVCGGLSFLVHLAVAAFLALARTRDPAPRHLLCLLPVLGVVNAELSWAAFDPPLEGLSTFSFLAREVLLAAQPGAILAFLTVFPSQLARWRALTLGAALLGVTLSLGSLVRAASGGAWDGSRGGPFTTGAVLLITLANLAVLGRLLWAMRPAESADVRMRARIVAVPTLLYVALLVALNNLPSVLGVDQLPGSWDAALSIVFPVSIALAVSRRRLFEIDRLVRMGLGYALVSGILLAGFVAVVPGIVALTSAVLPGIPQAGPLTSGLLAVVLFLLLQPLRRRIQRLVDRLFYRADVADPIALLDGVLGVPEPGRSDEESVRLVLSKVEAALFPSAQRILLVAEPGADEPGGSTARTVEIRPASARPPGGETPAVLADELASELRVLGAGSRLVDELDPRAAGLELYGSDAVLVVPLLSSQGEPLGVWTLGEKRSEEPYSSTERRALETIARALSLALERRRLTARAAGERAGRQRLVSHLARLGAGALAECPRCGRCDDAEGPCPADGAATVFSQPFPRVLDGRYALERRLGAGGMGIVYAARDEALRRDVAVKVVRGERAEIEEDLLRLRREAQVLARIAHPGVVAVHDLGELPGGGLYVVMERLTGESLDFELRRRSRVPWREAADLLDGILSPLQAAHERGIVHRDVKPGNIFLAELTQASAARGTPSGRAELIQASPSAAPRVRLLDFGLARPLETRAGSVGPETRTGAIVGTLGYMAPEVLAGSPASVRSDLFSVGVVGYELLAGRRPFDGATVVAQHEQMSRGPARPLESIVPGIPPALADTIASLLRPEPADRPASAGAVRERLASLREV